MTITKISAIFVVAFSFAFSGISFLHSQNTMQEIWRLNGEIDGQKLGSHVAGVGDVNRDGYDDVAVCNSPTGKTSIYFGGINMDNIPDLVLKGGSSVSSAGDVNADGFKDILTSDYDNVYLYLGSTMMDSIVDLIFHEEGGEHFGSGIDFITDFNGDGFGDIFIMDVTYSNYTGKVYVYFGGNPMDNQADWTKQGESEWIYFASGLTSGFGDLNRDGYSDIIIPNGWYPGKPDYSGNIQIYFGGASPDTICDVSIDGVHPDDLFGYSLSAAGDVNGDGYADIFVGAPGYQVIGNAQIYFGGLEMDTIPDVVMVGDSLLDRAFGSSVAYAGDVNGDGYNDVIIGDRDSFGGIGSARIYLGGSNMDGKPDVTIIGNAADYYFGSSVNSAGDVNGDGYDDVIIGSPLHAWFGEHDRGSAAIFLGNGRLTSVREEEVTPAEVPNSYFLCQNYPNPFNSSTRISYILKSASLVNLQILNCTGELVKTLTMGRQLTGEHSVTWKGRDNSGKFVPSGVYFYQIQAGQFTATKKLLLLK